MRANLCSVEKGAMLHPEELKSLTRDVATTFYGSDVISDVILERAPPGGDERDEVKILVVLKDDVDLSDFSGRKMNEFSLSLLQALQRLGDDRFPIVTYTFQNELAERLADDA